MPHHMDTDTLGEPCFTNSTLDRFIDDAGIDVVTPNHTASWIGRQIAGRKHILPSPLTHCGRIFLGQRMRQIDLAAALRQISLMNQPDFRQMTFQQRD